ncbi:MAG: DUF308 domain-containing protein [Candidatus Limiplasma sp.]|nr:DUF308 domain-containing protein [Candidatus Limiplasma sp.]MEA5144957.1 DUF308 domain-containing protein [Candidatus Limiplasma sp.]
MKKTTSRWSFTGWAMILFYAICGLLLLLWPSFTWQIANYALSFVLLIVGIVMIVGYIRTEALDGMLGYGLSTGLILALLGVLLLFNGEVLQTLLPAVWGLAMLAGGFGKLQMAFDLKRVGQGRWWLLLIGAGISFLLGVLSVTRPVFMATVATQFAGIALLVEALLDMVALLMLKREIKHLKVSSGV